MAQIFASSSGSSGLCPYTGLLMQGTGAKRRLAEAPVPAQRSAIIGASVWLRPPYRSGSYASLASQLSAANVSAIGSAMQIQGVQGLSKIGVRGNGKCEIGELPTPDNAGADFACPDKWTDMQYD